MKRQTVCVTNNKSNVKLSVMTHTVIPAAQRQREGEHVLFSCFKIKCKSVVDVIVSKALA